MTTSRVLIVENEILIAIDLESVIEDLGYRSAGIAPDARAAFALASGADFAFVDMNLRDGPTGAAIGERLARDYGIAVVFITANPRMLGAGVRGAIGVIGKPWAPSQIEAALRYADASARGELGLAPPRGLALFAPPPPVMFASRD